MASIFELRAAMRFVYEGGRAAERRYPATVSWRTLPGTLIERPEGGQWILELDGQAPLTVRSGEVLVVPRGVVHRLRMAGARRMRTTWMMSEFEGLAGMDLVAASHVSPVLPNAAGNVLSGLMARLRDLDAVVARGELMAAAQCQATGYEVLTVLLQYAAVRCLPAADPDLARLLPVLRGVEANPGAPMAVCDLARQACLSPSRFHAVFKRIIGVAPMDYVRQARIRLSQRLLITSTLPIAEVAVLAGFESPYYFSRAFRREVRMTPMAFRRDPHWHCPPSPPVAEARCKDDAVYKPGSVGRGGRP